MLGLRAASSLKVAVKLSQTLPYGNMSKTGFSFSPVILRLLLVRGVFTYLLVCTFKLSKSATCFKINASMFICTCYKKTGDNYSKLLK